MNRRAAAVIAWSMWVLAAVAILASGFVSAQYPLYSIIEEFDPVANFIWSASWIGFGLVGALIVSQRPGTRIGWILCGISFSIAVSLIAAPYARGNLISGGGWPLASLAAWLAAWSFQPAFGLVVALLLLFPTGHLSGRFRRALAGALLLAAAVSTGVAMVMPGPIEGDAPPVNPLGLEHLAAPLEATLGVATTIIGVIALIALFDLGYRAVRAGATERQQFKWLALAALAFPVLFVIALAVEIAVMGERGFDPVTLVFFVCGNGMAAAIGVAVTRYGLYEIPRVVSRTVTYALLTALLIAVYLLTVTVLTAVTAPVTGDSPIAVAAATLLAAGVFGPARRRIQAAVDRRFNRARYDAARTIDAYRGRLRDEVDLEALVGDLLTTVKTSMQPAGASLWLRGGLVDPKEILKAPVAVTVPERGRETKGT